MRYQCVQCDEKFELRDGEEQRCPKCMRVHGLRPLATESSASPERSRVIPLIAAGALLLAAAGGGYFWYQRQQVPSDPAELARRPLPASALSAELERRGLKAEPLASLLEADDAVERFAERAVSGQSSDADKAAAVVKALRARASAQAYVPWSLSDPRAEPPRTAAETLAALAKDGARLQLYPLEIAALGVAALRAVDVPAMLAEVRGVTGERAPLDASGRFGYFAIALADKPQTQLFDAYGGRSPFAAEGQALRSDIEAVGAALSLRASSRLAQNEDPGAALRDADAAIKLLPGSAAVRTARGTVLLANAAADLGESELKAAAQMAPDAARRNIMAMLNLTQGQGEVAAREVSQALAERPDFALGHVTLAAVHLSAGEREQARAALEKAEALDPNLSAVLLTWSQFYASAGQNEQALSYAKRAVDAKPKDPQARLLLAGLYRQAARYDDMRTEARAVLELTPASSRERMRELIGRLLGPTALEPGVEDTGASAAPAAPDAADNAAPGEAPAAAAPGGSQLRAPSSGDGSRLRLLDGQGAGDPSTGTLKAQDGAPKLKLTQPGTGLSLGDP
jgi:tetratricopeptide (TPR) repeat protein